ncbi:MAG TPA: response regulator [Pirellulales bacterium]|nr:response regulator [Pirellulales bacterium]
MPTATLDPVFIIDDDPAARESMAALIQSHGLQAETFASAEDFLARFDRCQTGCIVVDVRMTGMSGLDLQERLIQEGTDLPLIVITGYGDIPTAVRAMRNGATTFLEKPCSDQKLWESISQALETEAAGRGQRLLRGEVRRRLTTLTSDEHRVLEKLIEGRPNKTIARDLDLGLRTVELRRAMILQKMQASSLAELVRMVVISRESIHSSSAPQRISADAPDVPAELPHSPR